MNFLKRIQRVLSVVPIHFVTLGKWFGDSISFNDLGIIDFYSF